VVKSIHDPRYVELIGRLRRARQGRGVQQSELAARLGRPQSYVSKIETGERRLDLVELLDICRALDVPLEAIVPAELQEALRAGPRG
jgi:transcriptional regulator with XRE-family HTH domain